MPDEQPRPAAVPDRSTMRSLERALDVMETLQRAPGPLRLSEVAGGSGLTLPTASRILATLQARGYVAAESRRFRLGPAVLAAAHSFLVNDRLVESARPTMQDLASTTGLTASFYERVGVERVLVARVDGRWPLRYELPIGRRLPLHLGAGKAIAVDLDADELDLLARHLERHPDVSGVPLQRDALLADLEALRQKGFHLSVSERAQGVAAVSVPVRDAAGALLGALSVAGPAEQHPPEDLVRWSAQVVRAAAAVAESYARGA